LGQGSGRRRWGHAGGLRGGIPIRHGLRRGRSHSLGEDHALLAGSRSTTVDNGIYSSHIFEDRETALMTRMLVLLFEREPVRHFHGMHFLMRRRRLHAHSWGHLGRSHGVLIIHLLDRLLVHGRRQRGSIRITGPSVLSIPNLHHHIPLASLIRIPTNHTRLTDLRPLALPAPAAHDGHTRPKRIQQPIRILHHIIMLLAHSPHNGVLVTGLVGEFAHTTLGPMA
jgi:hypothetical protein